MNILGVGVSPITMDRALRTFDDWIARRDPHYVCVTNLHGIIESQRDPRLRSIHNGAGLVTPDGMPLVWVSRLLGFRGVERVYGPDLLLAMCGHSAPRGYRHFFYGGAAGVPAQLAATLRRRFPDLQVAGTYSPPFRPLTDEEQAEIVRLINAASPDIVWVGLGTPKQEHWMAAHTGRLTAPVLAGIGAAFDFHAGRKKQAPRWMQRSGLEWCFRLGTEPRRLWRRYATIIPTFLALFGLQFVGLREYTLD